MPGAHGDRHADLQRRRGDVFAGLRATYESLARHRRARALRLLRAERHQPARCARGRAGGVDDLVRALASSPDAAPGACYYRWRQRRSKRKAGNVADFCRRWGRDYRYMIVLDADSVMTGDCLTTLVRLMEANPTPASSRPRRAPAATRRCMRGSQQFGSRVYGPLFTAGMHFWQLGESHYWGHNAILRIEPFIDHCGLAAVAGSRLAVGRRHVARLRRGRADAARRLEGLGHRTTCRQLRAGAAEPARRTAARSPLVPRQPAERPPDVRAEPARGAPQRVPDRRAGLLSAPLWLGFLLLSTLLFTRHAHDIPIYFIEPYQMFPIWPSANLKLILTLVRTDRRAAAGAEGDVAAGDPAAPPGLVLRRCRAPADERADRVPALAAAGAGADAVPHPVLHRRADRLEARMEVAAARRRRDDLGRGGPPARRAHAARAGLGRCDPCERRAVPVWLSPIIVGLLAGIPLSVGAAASAPGAGSSGPACC